MLVCKFCGEVFEDKETLAEHLADFHHISTDDPLEFALIDGELIRGAVSTFFSDGEPYDDVDVIRDGDKLTLKFYFLVPCISLDGGRESAMDTLRKAFEVVSRLPFGEFGGIEAGVQDEFGNCYHVLVVRNIGVEEIM